MRTDSPRFIASRPTNFRTPDPSATANPLRPPQTSPLRHDTIPHNAQAPIGPGPLRPGPHWPRTPWLDCYTVWFCVLIKSKRDY